MAKRGRPATGETPKRSVRVPDAIWDEAIAQAKAEGKDLSEIINAFLRRYVARRKRQAGGTEVSPDGQ